MAQIVEDNIILILPLPDITVLIGLAFKMLVLMCFIGILILMIHRNDSAKETHEKTEEKI